MTGVYEMLDSEGTIRLALQINPEVRNIYVFHDQTESGEASGQNVIQAVARINREREERLFVHCLKELSNAEILGLVASLEKDSIVLVGSYSMDISGQALAPEVFVLEICEHSAVPVYSVYEFLLGNGIVGGNLLSARLQGEHAAALSLEIFNGKEAGQLPIVEDPTIVTAFDYKKLEQFAIPKNVLPANSVLINKPFSFLEEYRSLIIRVVAVFFCLLGLVIVLLINIKQRHEKEKELLRQKEELTALYEELTAIHEELTASEEELRVQYEELAQNQKALRQSEERYRLALEAARDTIWEWDLIKNERVYSRKLLETFEYEGEEVLKFEDWLKRIHREDLPLVEAKLNDHLNRKTENYHCEYRFQDKDGQYKWIRAYGKAIFDENGKPVRMVGSHQNITDLKEQAERIKHLAYHDYLTGLPNRVMLQEIVNKEIAGANGGKRLIALIFLDVDNFKDVNVSYGHAGGDRLLQVISRQLAQTVGNTNVVARFGGDEFIVLLRDIRNKQEVITYAEKIMKIFEKPLRLDNIICHATASAGIAFYPDDGDKFEELFKNADTAMFNAKKMGKRKYVVFNQEMHIVAAQKARIQDSLRRAIAQQEFVLHYQPQMELHSGRILGFEALLRWYSPEEGLIPPDIFISIAEETGLIIEIGDWVLREACAFAKRVHELGYRDVTVSVNISTIQLQQEDFAERIENILANTGFDPYCLVLEVTETALIDFIDSNVNIIFDKLRAQGIKISLDDFGRGYSSLNYIKELPISNLKVDKSFIKDIQGPLDRRNITGAIIVLAHQLGLRVIAEGVESEVQKEYLLNFKCDAVQGNLICEPLPPEEVLRVLAQECI